MKRGTAATRSQSVKLSAVELSWFDGSFLHLRISSLVSPCLDGWSFLQQRHRSSHHGDNQTRRIILANNTPLFCIGGRTEKSVLAGRGWGGTRALVLTWWKLMVVCAKWKQKWVEIEPPFPPTSSMAGFLSCVHHRLYVKKLEPSDGPRS